tara:strand:+ start:323 stop:577 length:255 start_codon:yes stop_codon:yes gene_type:complete
VKEALAIMAPLHRTVETAVMPREAVQAAQLFSKQIAFQSALMELLVPQVEMVETVQMQFGHLAHPYSCITVVMVEAAVQAATSP